MQIFKQSPSQFISSKTNWASVAGIVIGIYGISTQTISPEVALLMIQGGLTGIGLKDSSAGK